jgi:hypothetical protein
VTKRNYSNLRHHHGSGEVEVIILPDGRIMLPAGAPESVISVFKDLVDDPATLDRFQEISDAEIVAGDPSLCG